MATKLLYERIGNIKPEEVIKHYNEVGTQEDRAKLREIREARTEDGKKIGYRKTQSLIAKAFPEIVKHHKKKSALELAWDSLRDD